MGERSGGSDVVSCTRSPVGNPNGGDVGGVLAGRWRSPQLACRQQTVSIWLTPSRRPSPTGRGSPTFPSTGARDPAGLGALPGRVGPMSSKGWPAVARPARGDTIPAGNNGRRNTCAPRSSQHWGLSTPDRPRHHRVRLGPVGGDSAPAERITVTATPTPEPEPVDPDEAFLEATRARPAFAGHMQTAAAHLTEFGSAGQISRAGALLLGRPSMTIHGSRSTWTASRLRRTRRWLRPRWLPSGCAATPSRLRRTRSKRSILPRWTTRAQTSRPASGNWKA